MSKHLKKEGEICISSYYFRILSRSHTILLKKKYFPSIECLSYDDYLRLYTHLFLKDFTQRRMIVAFLVFQSISDY